MAYDSETGGRRPRRALNRFRLKTFRPGPARGLWALTLAVGLATALLAPLTLTAPQFLTLFLGGALAGGLAGMLPWSLSETRSLDSTAALLDSARKAEAGAVFAVAAGVLVEGLGTYGWAVVLSAGPRLTPGRRVRLGRRRPPPRASGRRAGSGPRGARTRRRDTSRRGVRRRTCRCRPRQPRTRP